MFASPVSPPRVVPSRDVLPFLRLITSPACRDEQDVLLSAVAALCGVSRLLLYRMLWTGRVSDDLAALFTPLIRRFEAGKLRFRRTSPRSSEPNRWEKIET